VAGGAVASSIISDCHAHRSSLSDGRILSASAATVWEDPPPIRIVYARSTVCVRPTALRPLKRKRRIICMSYVFRICGGKKLFAHPLIPSFYTASDAEFARRGFDGMKTISS